MKVLPTIRLTNHQKNIILMTANGKTSRQAAKELGVGVRAVEQIRFSLMKKFKARNFYQVISDCFRLNIID